MLRCGYLTAESISQFTNPSESNFDGACEDTRKVIDGIRSEDSVAELTALLQGVEIMIEDEDGDGDLDELKDVKDDIMLF
jgi:hypothetical protein